MGFLKNLPLYKKADLRYLCTYLVPLTDLLTTHYGSIYCPFHHNVNTPAASLFKDKDGAERIYCYSCKKQFTSYDYITLILEKDPIQFLLKKYTKEQLDEVLEHRTNIFEQHMEKLTFQDMETFLGELYNYDLCMPPKQT